MTWFNDYQRRLNISGDNETDRLQNNLQENFEFLLANSPCKATIVDGSTTYEVIIEDKQRFGKDTDDKLLFSRVSDNLNIGFVFSWRNKQWMLVNSEENVTNQSKDFYLGECITSIKWIDELGIEHEEYCIYSKFGKGNDGITESKPLILGSSQSSILVQSNEHTQKFSKAQGNRFILSNKVFKLVDIETSLMPGLLIITLEEDQERVGKDDMVNRIAENIYENIPTPPPPSTGFIIEGNGDDGIIYCNLSFKFEAKLYEGDILVDPQPTITYSIDKSDLVEFIQSDNLLTIKPKSFTTDNRDKKIILTANDGNGHIATKELIIRR
ncbi:MAG: cupin domain-containing protein [Desulfobacterales bacterium]|nr:cupin domain-containing protein [Desulfobacterales bacterium]